MCLWGDVSKEGSVWGVWGEERTSRGAMRGIDDSMAPWRDGRGEERELEVEVDSVGFPDNGPYVRHGPIRAPGAHARLPRRMSWPILSGGSSIGRNV